MSQLVDTSPVLTESPTRADQDTATLYDCYGSRIREYCYGQLRDRQEADDAVQSTFLYAFTLLRRGETPRKPLPWLYTIAHNVCRTRRRALKRRSRVESGVDLDAVQETIGRNDPPHEDLAHLASSLAQLPLAQRTALLLREWQGLSYSEIAAELGLTESAVEAVLFRARRNLAKKLQYVSDRAATIAGTVLLLPSLRRLSSYGTAAKTATVTAVLVGSTALLPVGDAPRASRAVEPAVTPSSTPAAPKRTRVTVGTDRALVPRITTRAQATSLDNVPVATGTKTAAVTSAPPAGPASADGNAAPIPAPAPPSTASETPAAAPTAPKAVPNAVQATLDTTNSVVNTVQTAASTVESTVASATNTVTSTASTVASQVTSAAPQLPTVPSPLESPPKNTSLPGLPSLP